MGQHELLELLDDGLLLDDELDELELELLELDDEEELDDEDEDDIAGV